MLYYIIFLLPNFWGRRVGFSGKGFWVMARDCDLVCNQKRKPEPIAGKHMLPLGKTTNPTRLYT